MDRVLGGGAVKGSLVLVGGAPGIGKSTLMLQICSKLCEFSKVLYVSGEESEHQLKLRAKRLNVESEQLFVISETCLGDVLETVAEEQPDILIIDSIQTLYNDALESPAGSVGQVKDCTMRRTSSLLTRSRGVVALFPADFTVGICSVFCTGETSCPLAKVCSTTPIFPSLCSRNSTGASASSPMVLIPPRRSFSLVAGPT